MPFVNMTDKKQDRAGPVKIIRVSAYHTDTCAPASKEKIAIIPSSTKSKSIDPVVFVHLMYLRNATEQRLSTKLIRAVIKNALPDSWYLSSQGVLNIREKIERLTKDSSSLGGSIDVDAATSAMTPEQWMSDLNTCLDDNVSAIHKSLDKIIEVIEDTYDNNLFHLEKLLNLCKKEDPEFNFIMGTNPEGKFTGCVWQTGVMYRNYEKCGNFIAFDAMRREINNKNWVYLAMTIKTK